VLGDPPVRAQLEKLSQKFPEVRMIGVSNSSHVTGGALLGDRLRMTESTDSGTYIQSIASRGSTGAVSRSIRNIIRILEYAGFDPIIIESVGAGQTEVDISKIVDITAVVFNPHTGDSIQTIKAGISEIGDIYIVNKSDLSGASQLYASVQDYIGSSEKKPIVLKTSVKKNLGIQNFAKILKQMIFLIDLDTAPVEPLDAILRMYVPESVDSVILNLSPSRAPPVT